MDKQAVKDRVTKVTAGVLRVDAGNIKPESNFIFDLGAESTQSVALIAAFEEEFDIDMDGEKAMEIQTVSGAVDFIYEYVKNK